MWSLYLVNSLDFELSLTFVTDTALITVHFGEINHTTCALYFFFNIVIKICTVLILLLQGVSVETTSKQCRGRKVKK